MSLILHDIAFLQHGPTLSMTIESGQTLCVVGPTGSGKTRLLKAISGQQSADRGTVSSPGPAHVIEPSNRKQRPQDLSHRKGENRAVLATEVLSHLGLWDVRQRLVSELTPSQVTACDLVEVFMSDSKLIVLDENLDRLDPWIRVETFKLIRDRCSRGAIVVVSTNQLDLASQFDWVVVLKDYQKVYAGPVFELISKRGQRSLTIESERAVGVRALVEPLLVGVARTESGYRLTPGPGQEQTAKMLREGYGDIKFVVTDERPLTEIILDLLR